MTVSLFKRAMPLQMICRTNPNGVDFSGVGCAGSRRPDQLTAAEINFACAGMSREEDALFRYTFLGDDFRGKVYAALMMAAMELEVYQQFKKRHLGELEPLVYMAIAEFVKPPLCKSCGGSGQSATLDDCDVCGGSGYKSLSNRFKARQLGRGHKYWYQYKPMYEALFDLLWTWKDGYLAVWRNNTTE